MSLLEPEFVPFFNPIMTIYADQTLYLTQKSNCKIDFAINADFYLQISS